MNIIMWLKRYFFAIINVLYLSSLLSYHHEIIKTIIVNICEICAATPYSCRSSIVETSIFLHRFRFVELMTAIQEPCHTIDTRLIFGKENGLANTCFSWSMIGFTLLHPCNRAWVEKKYRFIMQMLSYQYRKSHSGDTTVVRSSYLHNGISYTGKMRLYIESGPCIVMRFLFSHIICLRHTISPLTGRCKWTECNLNVLLWKWK